MRPKTCKKYVLGGTNFFTTRRCRRTVFKDGLCKIHQPEAIREREKKREERFEHKSRAFKKPYEDLNNMREDHDRYKRERDDALAKLRWLFQHHTPHHSYADFCDCITCSTNRLLRHHGLIGG